MSMIIIKHLHSCFATASTGDRSVKMILDLPFAPFVGLKLLNGDEEIEVKHVYYDMKREQTCLYAEADKTYYSIDNLRSRATDADMDKLVAEYVERGWKEA